MQARNFPSGILTEASQIRKKGRAQQTHRNSLFRGILDPFGVFPRKFCANCVGALNSMHKSYVLGFFEIALQTVISSTLYQRIPVGSTEQPLHLPLVTNQKNVICRSCVRDAPCLATSRRWEPLRRNPFACCFYWYPYWALLYWLRLSGPSLRTVGRLWYWCDMRMEIFLFLGNQ